MDFSYVLWMNWKPSVESWKTHQGEIRQIPRIALDISIENTVSKRRKKLVSIKARLGRLWINALTGFFVLQNDRPVGAGLCCEKDSFGISPFFVEQNQRCRIENRFFLFPV
jgi:hypothetical protein